MLSELRSSTIPSIPEHVMRELRYIEVATGPEESATGAWDSAEPATRPRFELDEHQPYRPGRAAPRRSPAFDHAGEADPD